MAHKNLLLQHMLTDIDLKQAIVFTATKRDADMLAEDLFAQGHAAAALHGDMNQGARNRTLTKLRRGGLRVLVATDVAARGIDVAGISHVINFDLPKFAEDYVHRIGRTGRAGASGIAVSFASYRDMQLLQRIERFTGQAIAPHTIAGLEPKRVPRPSAPRSGQDRKFSGKPGPGGNRSASGQPRREGGFARSGEKRPNSGGFTHHSGRRHG